MCDTFVRVDLYHAREYVHSLARSREVHAVGQQDAWLEARLQDLGYSCIDGIDLVNDSEYGHSMGMKVSLSAVLGRWRITAQEQPLNSRNATW